MSDLLRYRQIHLDFHTSEQLTNIGGEFDVLEDVLPLYDVAVSLRPPGAVAGVRCAPQGGRASDGGDWAGVKPLRAQPVVDDQDFLQMWAQQRAEGGVVGMGQAGVAVGGLLDPAMAV